MNFKYCKKKRKDFVFSEPVNVVESFYTYKQVYNFYIIIIIIIITLQMLERLHSFIGCKQDVEKLVLRPVEILMVTPKRSLWTNFNEELIILKRSPQHLLHFIETETGSKCSINSLMYLNIRGRYNNTQIESLLVKYCRQFVLCKTCKSYNTILIKGGGGSLSYLECKTCMNKNLI
jgi:translation initiation factor 2 beta subunit (eIF-2beta)/eIF-5